MSNPDIKRYCQTPLMIAALGGGYFYALAPQADTLAPVPHLIALLYLAAHWKFAHRLSPGALRIATLVAGLSCGYTTWQSFGIINGIDPGTTLLSAAAIMKLSELRRYRDYFIILMINLYLLNTNFLYSFSYGTTAYVLAGNLLIFYLMTVCSSAVRIGPAVSARQVRSLAALIAGAPGWIGENFRQLRASGQLSFARRMTALVMIVALPVTVVVFVAYPRMQINLFNLHKSTTRAMTGFSPFMEPGRFSDLVNDDRIAFRANFEGALPRPGQLYWRALTLERYAGGRWETVRTARPFRPDRAIVDESAFGPGQTGETGQAGAEASPGQFQYEIILPDHQSSWLFALDHPTAVVSGTVDLFLDSNGQLSTQLEPGQVVSYTLQSQTGLLNPADRPGYERNLRLPPYEGERARALASQWQGSPRQKLDQAIAWLKAQNFEYTLSTAEMTTNTIDRFLFEEKAGYCEHFSSSFAFLMRAAGVPARIVIGYQGGKYSEAGSTLRVHQYAAHAWTEVLLPQGQGWYWRRVDPTVLAEPQRLLLTANELLGAVGESAEGGEGVFGGIDVSWLVWAGDVLFEIEFAWDRWVLSYSGDQQQELLEWLRGNDRLWLNILWILGLAAILSYALYRFGTRWLGRAGDPLVALFDDFRQLARKHGVPAAPSQGCQTIGEALLLRLRASIKDKGASQDKYTLLKSVPAFAGLWQRARYRRDFDGGDEPVSKADHESLKRHLANIRRIA